MLRIYGIKKEGEYISFWLRKSDADTHATSEEDSEVVPIKIKEDYPRIEED